MSSHTVISPTVPAESGSSGTRQAMLLRPLPGERREAVVSDSQLRRADGQGAEVLARLFPRHETNAGALLRAIADRYASSSDPGLALVARLLLVPYTQR